LLGPKKQQKSQDKTIAPHWQHGIAFCLGLRSQFNILIGPINKLLWGVLAQKSAVLGSAGGPTDRIFLISFVTFLHQGRKVKKKHYS